MAREGQIEKNRIMWTLFKDRHSGGLRKESTEFILIEAPKEQAREVFGELFERDPDHVTCPCCGPDYGVYEHESRDYLGQLFSIPDVPFNGFISGSEEVTVVNRERVELLLEIPA